jgi:hypothetical protein
MSPNTTILVKLNQNLNVFKFLLLFLNYLPILLFKLFFFMYLTFKYIILLPFRLGILLFILVIYILFFVLNTVLALPAFIIMKEGEALGILLGVIGLGGGLIVYFLSGPSALLESMGIYSLLCCLLGILFYKLAQFIQFYFDTLFEKLDLNLKSRINSSFLDLFKFLSKKEKITMINLGLWYLQRFLVAINKIYSESTIDLITEQDFIKTISSNTFFDKKLSKIIGIQDRFEKLEPYNKEVFLFAKNQMNKHHYFDYFKFNSKSNAFMFIIRLI